MFQVYLPGRRGADLGHLRDAGLGGLLLPHDDSPGCEDLVGPGPDGQYGGQIWHWLTDGPQDIGYHAERQEWIEGSGYWLGWTAGRKPTPPQLARKRQIDGRWITLRDGREWLVPDAQQVPKVCDFARNQWSLRPDPAYQGLIDSGVLALSACLGHLERGEPIDTLAAAQHALAALQWNYRLPGELAAGLFTSDNLFAVLAAFSDTERIRQAVHRLGEARGAPTPSS